MAGWPLRNSCSVAKTKPASRPRAAKPSSVIASTRCKMDVNKAISLSLPTVDSRRPTRALAAIGRGCASQSLRLQHTRAGLSNCPISPALAHTRHTPGCLTFPPRLVSLLSFRPAAAVTGTSRVSSKGSLSQPNLLCDLRRSAICAGLSGRRATDGTRGSVQRNRILSSKMSSFSARRSLINALSARQKRWWWGVG